MSEGVVIFLLVAGFMLVVMGAFVLMEVAGV